MSEETIFIPENGSVSKKNDNICGICKNTLRRTVQTCKLLDDKSKCYACKIEELDVKTIIENDLIYCRRQLICTCPVHTTNYIICDNCRNNNIEKFFSKK